MLPTSQHIPKTDLFQPQRLDRQIIEAYSVEYLFLVRANDESCDTLQQQYTTDPLRDNQMIDYLVYLYPEGLERKKEPHQPSQLGCGHLNPTLLSQCRLTQVTRQLRQ